MSNCLVISGDADALVDEVRRRDDSIPLQTCASAADALDTYAGQDVLLGEPDLIAPVLGRMKNVDWVQSTWAGVTPLLAVERRDYVLTGIKDVFGPQMAEYVFGHLLAHALQLPERRAAQQEHEWFGAPSATLEGHCLGIMGTGSIGRHIATTAAAFGLRVIGLSRSGADAAGFDSVYPLDGLGDFLAASDYLVSTLPGTEATAGLLDAAALAQLPDHAYFINVGRSNVVDHAALVDALRGGRLAGAALDVFDEEPLPPDSPLWDTPNLAVTAHVAAVSHPALIAPIFVENYRRYRNGQPLAHVVDFEAGY